VQFYAVIKPFGFEIALLNKAEFAAGCQLLANIGNQNLPAFASRLFKYEFINGSSIAKERLVTQGGGSAGGGPDPKIE
jgi:hypothetical protein